MNSKKTIKSGKEGALGSHITAGMSPLIRVDSDIRRINVSEVGHKEFYSLIYEIMSDKQRKDYEEFLETGFSIEIPTLSAFV